MATTFRTPRSAERPPTVDVPSARAALAPKEDTRTRLLRLAIVIVAFGVFVLGWRVTDINLGKLANAANAGPILKALVTPDLVGRDVTQTELQAPFVSGSTSTDSTSVSSPTGQTLTISPAAAQPGETVTFDGSGFAPDADGDLRIVFPNGGRDARFTRITTDGRGAFHEQRTWPDAATLPPGNYTFRFIATAPSGTLHISDTLANSLGRMGETILLALMGTLFGVVFSVPLSFLGARNLMGSTGVGSVIYWCMRLIFTITRSIEVLIVGLIMVVIVGIGSYAGVLALVVHTIGSLGKLYSEAIESIDPGPVEAITATGASRFQTILFGVIPQVVPEFLAVTIFWWDHNVRMATVIGLVGAGGVGYLLIQYINLLQYQQAATVLWLIVIVVTAMDYASARIRARLV
ncbi:MAG: phosphonate ABC transporter, permease protein PhnE [Chloroflexi bacterium]|nr:phosphonate ABC transporter, permease protein PhnE [Chloroflexota bacterium]